MNKLSIKKLSELLQSKKISSEELTRYYISRIKSFDSLLNSFITVIENDAINQAKIADNRIASGNATLLTGIPFAIKDIFYAKNTKTSCASKMLDNFISPYDSTVVKKLKDAGAILIGKTNLDEFAMGSSNEHSYYGAVKNPWDLSRVPGGSSGGSAAAVAARLVPFSIGTDSGGSIRQPAALTGITGLKPTYGRVSHFGMIPFAPSLDQGGPMTVSAEDAAIVLDFIAGFDIKDSSTVNIAENNFTKNLEDDIRGIKIGLLKDHFNRCSNDCVVQNVLNCAYELEKRGAIISDISLPSCNFAISVYQVISSAEFASNFSNSNFICDMYKCIDRKDLRDFYNEINTEYFGHEVKHRILVGTYVLSHCCGDTYYKKAQKIRRIISNDFSRAFSQVDVILSPTSPTTAFPIGSKQDNRVEMYLSDMYLTPASLAGLPGISIPVGFCDNLPVGAHFVGNYFSENRLLNIAHQYQKETVWHKCIPKNFNI
jgi:aspartyl-tRNA(Asn)/glutamyl-tRNA(Gln) amidotransferase subunit A